MINKYYFHDNSIEDAMTFLKGTSIPKTKVQEASDYLQTEYNYPFVSFCEDMDLSPENCKELFEEDDVSGMIDAIMEETRRRTSFNAILASTKGNITNP